jgi:hypothetical protein
VWKIWQISGRTVGVRDVESTAVQVVRFVPDLKDALPRRRELVSDMDSRELTPEA